MQRSNTYILIYTIILTVACGVILALASEGLKPMQKANIELEQKKFILQTVDPTVAQMPAAELTDIYSKRVRGIVINSNGDVMEGLDAASIVVAAEYKKPENERKLPIYLISDGKTEGKVDYYVLPVYGFGLWDNIWGFVALEGDMNTIKGVVFDHKGETPGLGARISTAEIQDRFAGKKIADGSDFKSVMMMKGEGNDYTNNPHAVDGMSGATITGVGLSDMLSNYLKLYFNYFKKNQNQQAQLVNQNE